MTAGMRSETSAAPAAAAPERPTPASPARALPGALLQLQRTAGNAAVARAVARPATRALQRCGGDCGCSTCSGGHPAEDELLEEQRGAGLLRSAVARRSA